MHHHARRDFATPDAGRRNHPHAVELERLQELKCARELAGDRVAYAHGERFGRAAAFLHHLEVMVKSRHFVHLGEREAHLLRQGGEMRGRQMTELVVESVQVLDEEIATSRRVAEQRLDLGRRLRIDDAALRNGANPGFRHALARIIGQ
jgi:hypothetical protein